MNWNWNLSGSGKKFQSAQCPSNTESQSAESQTNTMKIAITEKDKNGRKEVNPSKNDYKAENYVKNVMPQNVVKIRNSSDEGISSQPLQHLVTRAKTGRKRHLSLPNINDSNVEQLKVMRTHTMNNPSESDSVNHEPKM